MLLLMKSKIPFTKRRESHDRHRHVGLMCVAEPEQKRRGK
jgi:hypothetical protein